jgi:hypothetical protein
MRGEQNIKYIAYVFVFISSIIVFKLFKFTVSDEA